MDALVIAEQPIAQKTETTRLTYDRAAASPIARRPRPGRHFLVHPELDQLHPVLPRLLLRIRFDRVATASASSASNTRPQSFSASGPDAENSPFSRRPVKIAGSRASHRTAPRDHPRSLDNPPAYRDRILPRFLQHDPLASGPDAGWSGRSEIVGMPRSMHNSVSSDVVSSLCRSDLSGPV